MASTFNYATLVAAMQNWVEDQGAQFEDDVDTIIRLAEDRVLKGLPLSIFDSNEALTAVIAGTHAKPTGTILTRSLYLLISSSKTFLARRSKSYIEAYWPNAATTGVPKYYADDYSSTHWLLGPTPAAGPNYSGQAVVMKRPESLVVDTSGTWMSTNVGDLLFKAAQVEAGIYTMADERKQVLDSEYMVALAASRYDLRTLIRTDYTQLAAQPAPQGER